MVARKGIQKREYRSNKVFKATSSGIGPLRAFMFSSPYYPRMSYKLTIPQHQLRIYRAAAVAYRNPRHKGGRQHEWHWAAVREVIRKCPEMAHREADDFAGHIIRHVSLCYREWFWK